MKKNKAFTLVEVLIVVVIIGVLAAIVIPQFQEALRQTARRVRIEEEAAAAKVTMESETETGVPIIATLERTGVSEKGWDHSITIETIDKQFSISFFDMRDAGEKACDRTAEFFNYDNAPLTCSIGNLTRREMQAIYETLMIKADAKQAIKDLDVGTTPLPAEIPTGIAQ